MKGTKLNKLTKRLDDESVQEIIEMKQRGLGSRFIAEYFDVSKSFVNQLYNKWLLQSAQPLIDYLEESKKQMNKDKFGVEYHPDDVSFKCKEYSKDYAEVVSVRKPKILFLDVESSPDVAVSFKRYKANMSQDHILEEGGWLLSVAYAFNDEPVESFCLSPVQAIMNDDSSLVATLWDAIEQADIIVAHNLAKFDLALFKARCVINGFPPPKRVKQVDTLKLARSMKFQSNRLDSLGVVLGEGTKIKHSGIQLWIDCMQGKAEALEEMKQYNAQDVELLRNVYHRLKAFDNNSPNAALFTYGEDVACRVCGSHDLTTTPNQIAAGSSLFSEVVCNDCGARSRLRTSNTTKEKRKSLLA
jgi:hypothetical protein